MNQIQSIALLLALAVIAMLLVKQKETKVVYVDRGLEYRTLMSNFRGQGDPQVLASSFDKPKPQRMAAERYLYGQRASGSSGPGSGTLSPTPSVHVPSQTPYKYRAQSPSPTPSES